MKTLKIHTPAFITDNGLTAVNLWDEITLQKADKEKIKINRKGLYKIPTNDTNLSFQIAEKLQKKQSVNISIQKNIPTNSGLLSQEGNAAGVLLGLNKLWNLNLNKNELLKVAKAIDPAIAQILRAHFSSQRQKPSPILLIRPRYIRFTNASKQHLKHFPDLQNLQSNLKKNGAYKTGLCNKSCMIYGLFEKPTSQKILKDLKPKIDFSYSGLTCKTRIKLIN